MYKIKPLGVSGEFYPVLFDETLQQDYELIARNFAKLRYHAPRLTWMGYGDTFWAFEEALKEFDETGDRKELMRVTREILDRCDQIRLLVGGRFKTGQLGSNQNQPLFTV